MTFNETDVVRDTGGRFDTKTQSAPELTLDVPTGRQRDPEHVGDDTRTGAEVLSEHLGAHSPVWVSPVGVTATRRALKNLRGEPDGGARVVSLDWRSIAPASDAGPLQVAGPKDGRPLIIDVRAGCPSLAIASGNVTVLAGGHGFAIDVAEGAHATVLGEPGHKVSVRAQAGSTVDFYAEEGCRGYQHVEEGATFKLHGNSESLTLSSDPR